MDDLVRRVVAAHRVDRHADNAGRRGNVATERLRVHRGGSQPAVGVSFRPCQPSCVT